MLDMFCYLINFKSFVMLMNFLQYHVGLAFRYISKNLMYQYTQTSMFAIFFLYTCVFYYFLRNRTFLSFRSLCQRY
ncbi:hypothetical protein Hanom_Chr14g01332651 [Helianthus anomalus]